MAKEYEFISVTTEDSILTVSWDFPRRAINVAIVYFTPPKNLGRVEAIRFTLASNAKHEMVKQ
jgi:hypothetical protein